MPHGDSVEAFAFERLFVEQTAVELDAFERLAAAQVFKVDADNMSAVSRTHFLQKGSYCTPDVENATRRTKLHVALHEFFLLPVVPVHHPVEKLCEWTPVGFFPVRDVLVVVKVFDVLDAKPRVLIAKAAALAGDEGERSRTTGEIIVGRKEVGPVCALTVVTRDFLKVGRRRSGLRRGRAHPQHGGVGCHRRKPPIESISSGRPASSTTSATKIFLAPYDS